MYNNNRYIIEIYNYVSKMSKNTFYILLEDVISSLYSHLKNSDEDKYKSFLNYVDKQNSRMLDDSYSMWVKYDYRLTILEEMIRSLNISDEALELIQISKNDEIYKKYIRAKSILKSRDYQSDLKMLNNQFKGDNMKISELVEELEKILKEEGDMEVVVHYRDSGGIYVGYDDEDISPYVDRNLNKVII